MAEDEQLRGAHLTVYRHTHSRLGAEARDWTKPTRKRSAAVFRSLSLDRHFTYEMLDLPSAELGPSAQEAFHLVVIFDRSAGRPSRARPAFHPIQPLAVVRRLQYRQVYKTVEVRTCAGSSHFRSLR